MSPNRVVLVLVAALTVNGAAALGEAVTCAAAPDVNQSQADAAEKPNEPDIERLVKDLISQDGKVARKAQKQLERMGHAVPMLFANLVEADWNLRPALLEVLASIKGGRDYARLKLFHGTEEEKTYAALLYELIDLGEDTESREYAAMVQILLKAIKNDDKKLRAAAGLALVYEENSTTVLFEHFHEIVTALISSFDTDLVVNRFWRGDPSDVVFLGICYRLDAMIGDRFGFLDFVSDPRYQSEALEGGDPFALRRTVPKFLSANREEIDKLKSYWQDWWNKHAEMTLTEIGKLMVERSLRLLPEREPTHEETRNWSGTKYERFSLAKGSLHVWGGKRGLAVEEFRSWWVENKATYEGPKGNNE